MREELDTALATETSTPVTSAAPAAGKVASHPARTEVPESPGIVEEVLVEEISIDGMCGVY